jgi:AcrR family transcriptional regulator
MSDWIPIPGTPRTRLAQQALRLFGRSGYDAVGVGDIARAAGVTTGALYHHFGSKFRLYDLVRTEAERRVRDRMEGASQAAGGRLAPALAVGFDAAWELEAAPLLAETPPEPRADALAAFLEPLGNHREPGAGALIMGAWRAALSQSVRDGAREPSRTALVALIRSLDRSDP